MLELLRKKWDDYFTAITFAEGGDVDTARYFLKRKRKERAPSPAWDEIFTAVTFAEAGELDTARLILHSKKRVLFILEEDGVNQEVLSYVEGLCKRLNLPVEVLVLSKSEASRSALEVFLNHLKSEGILFRVSYVESPLSLDRVLMEYVKKNEGVEFLIVKPSHKHSQAEDERIIKGIWERLGLPFILVKERGAM
ncbi:hypothetical protein THC_0880 [Caldimicrobium thiodismutans]|uniref:Uncharacterized protein n=1 Tax=Caldimicrobium thiodismutans TaxID=1653476 RepID=A0A0U5AQV1_9BACT|nr:hypothetical protein [Caldimicrobium thiodismutans]BAU23265.1 hypothetical protein THC_0880 [Caldimicrobium thiodismutans]